MAPERTASCVRAGVASRSAGLGDTGLAVSPTPTESLAPGTEVNDVIKTVTTLAAVIVAITVVTVATGVTSIKVIFAADVEERFPVAGRDGEGSRVVRTSGRAPSRSEGAPRLSAPRRAYGSPEAAQRPLTADRTSWGRSRRGLPVPDNQLLPLGRTQG